METEFYTIKGYYDSGRIISVVEATLRVTGNKVEGTEGSTYNHKNIDLRGFWKEDEKTISLSFSMNGLEFIVSKEQNSELSGSYKGRCITPSKKQKEYNPDDIDYSAEFTLTKVS